MRLLDCTGGAVAPLEAQGVREDSEARLRCVKVLWMESITYRALGAVPHKLRPVSWVDAAQGDLFREIQASHLVAERVAALAARHLVCTAELVPLAHTVRVARGREGWLRDSILFNEYL